MLHIMCVMQFSEEYGSLVVLTDLRRLCTFVVFAIKHLLFLNHIYNISSL